MLIYPAIDLLGGVCVRLYQGNYDAVTRFSDDPIRTARSFAEQGAEALHIVDLDGARNGTPAHAGLIGRIVSSVDIPVQVGGGIRTTEHLSDYLQSGVHRVLVGTMAVSDQDWLADAVARYGPDRVAAALDVRDGEVVINGWLARSGRDPESVAVSLKEIGIETLLYTDTRRDGTLTSVDVEGASKLIEAGFKVIAAGGISSVTDVRRLRRAGAAGAVIGSALYSGRIRLIEALEAAGGAAGGGRAC
ncbi:MAG: 1-(5-phosphoribosyl)-5-[(5-phosphoribosylamino)methylideneamino]imidazole-4-carboxamide isomerase [Gemmatimonadota bacterium]